MTVAVVAVFAALQALACTLWYLAGRNVGRRQGFRDGYCTRVRRVTSMPFYQRMVVEMLPGRTHGRRDAARAHLSLDVRREAGELMDDYIGIYKPRSGRVVFLDTETTGLDPAVEQVFEIATICGVTGRQRVYRIEPDADVVEAMHPKAAEVNRYHERTTDPGWFWDSPHHSADMLRSTLTGAHIVGAVPDFDARFLTAWYKSMGQDVPRWHYHLIDIENLAYGFLLRERMTAQEVNTLLSLPLDSDELSRLCGVRPVSDDERHTALGDARWVMRWWNQLHGRLEPVVA